MRSATTRWRGPQEAWTRLVLGARPHERDLAEGDFASAATVAIGPGPSDSAAQFTAVDDASTDGIGPPATICGRCRSAARVLTALGSGALVLTLIAFGRNYHRVVASVAGYQ